MTYPLKHWYARLVNRFALGAFGTGNMACRDFRRWGIASEKIACLPYLAAPGDSAAIKDPRCAHFAGDRPAFLFLGSLCHRKAVDILLHSFSSTPQDEKDWVLLLVGSDQSNGGYAAQSRRLNIQNRVFFRGPVGSSHLSSVLQCGKVLVLPSRFDGWGVVLNEAASMGLAIIASDQVGSAYHLIEPGRNGYLVKAGDATSLSNAMRAYIRTPGLAEEHGAQSRQLFPLVSPDSHARNFIRTLESWQAIDRGKRMARCA